MSLLKGYSSHVIVLWEILSSVYYCLPSSSVMSHLLNNKRMCVCVCVFLHTHSSGCAFSIKAKTFKGESNKYTIVSPQSSKLIFLASNTMFARLSSLNEKYKLRCS